MANITFLGLGAMGSRMVVHLINAGHSVTLWNRSQSAMQTFAGENITIAETPAKAAKHADFVFSMVRDNEASEFVWLDSIVGAINTMPDSAIGIECSTLTPDLITTVAQALQNKGIGFIDAPVVGSRPQAEAAKLIFLVGAENDDFERVEPLLSLMSGAVHHLGKVSAGSKLKLVVNALFGLQLAGLAELLGFLKNSEIDASEAMNAIGQIPVCSPAAKVSADAMLAGNFAPAFPVELVAKDFAYAVEAASQVNSNLPVSAKVGQIFETAKSKGFGNDNITGVVQLYM